MLLCSFNIWQGQTTVTWARFRRFRSQKWIMHNSTGDSFGQQHRYSTRMDNRYTSNSLILQLCIVSTPNQMFH